VREISRRRAAFSVFALSLAIALAASAGIPSASKIATAVAQANAAAGRGEPLWLDILLRIGEGEPAAKGVLTTHPTGLARLELENTTKGFVERHLLQGSSYRASRNGEALEQPLPFLPPFFLLQMRSGDALEAALTSFGIANHEPHLARLGDLDCWVIGAYSPNASASGEAIPDAGPAIWIDSATRQILRIERGDGVRLDFGPEVAYEKIRVPSWIAIHVEGRPPARLEIQRVSRANAPAAAFSNDWLSGR
jgi:hypothetical protein